MGADGQHVKLALRDKNSKVLQMLSFNAPEEFFRETGDEVVAWFQPTVNEWQVRTVGGAAVAYYFAGLILCWVKFCFAKVFLI